MSWQPPPPGPTGPPGPPGPPGQPPQPPPEWWRQGPGHGYDWGRPQAAYAGFWIRLAAALLDALLLSIPTAIVRAAFGVGSFRVDDASDVPWGRFLVANLIVTIGSAVYYAVMEGGRGQTLGKMACGIRVVDEQTFQPGIGTGRGFGRYFARLLSALPLGLGYLWMLWDDRKQTFHDKLAGTVVVKT